MTTRYNTSDTFEGVRTFPSEPDQLRHHLSRINHSLQTRYHISSEIAEFALQPDKTQEFHRFYQTEVQRIITHLNKVSKRQIKVHVDPMREPKGMAILKGKAAANAPLANEVGDASWRSSLTSTGRQFAQQEVISQKRMMDAAASAAVRTPTLAGRTGRPDDDCLVVDSAARPQKEACLFRTPPEFKGFAMHMATPSDREGLSPMGY